MDYDAMVEHCKRVQDEAPRGMISDTLKRAIRRVSRERSPETALRFADEVLEGFGAEYAASVNDSMFKARGVSYVNMGDVYNVTVLYDHAKGRFLYNTTLGDVVERHPKRFA